MQHNTYVVLRFQNIFTQTIIYELNSNCQRVSESKTHHACYCKSEPARLTAYFVDSHRLYKLKPSCFCKAKQLM